MAGGRRSPAAATLVALALALALVLVLVLAAACPPRPPPPRAEGLLRGGGAPPAPPDVRVATVVLSPSERFALAWQSPTDWVDAAGAAGAAFFAPRPAGPEGHNYTGLLAVATPDDVVWTLAGAKLDPYGRYLASSAASAPEQVMTFYSSKVKAGGLPATLAIGGTVVARGGPPPAAAPGKSRGGAA